MKDYNISGLRTLTVIANIFGIIGAVLGCGVLVYYMRLGWQNEMSAVIAAALYALIALVLVTNIVFCSIIINFVRTTDDITFINNRYILILFSLTAGGLITPYILMKLPNIDIKSTITPRIFISRGYGISALIAGGAALIVFLTQLSIKSGFNIIQENQQNQIIGYTTIGISALILFWGVLNTSLFMGTVAIEKYEQKGFRRGFMNFVSTMNLIFATVTLIYIILASIINIISAIGSLFDRNRGIFASLFNTAYVALTIMMQAFVIFTAFKTIKGIWNSQGVVEYNNYSKLAEKQNSVEMNRN